MKPMKVSLLIFCCMLLSLAIFRPGNAAAQTAPVVVDTTGNVVISYSQGSCQGQDVLFLKMQNNNGTAVTVNYSLFGGPMKSVVVPAGGISEGGCDLAHESLNQPIPAGQTIANLSPIINVN